MSCIVDQLSDLAEHSQNIIYADPPWKYQQTVKNGALKRKDGTLLYPSMSLKSLCALGPAVERICKEDAALFNFAEYSLVSPK